jgi:hypothetical protein
VTLNPNKSLPAGSIANLTDRPDDRFVTLTTVPADPGGGTFDVVFQAEEVGALNVAIGQLSEITVAVSGWTAVTNAAAGTTGTEPEADPDFRDKRDRELEASGSTNIDAIKAGVSQVSGVVDVTGFENPLSIVSGGLPPNSVAITVRGGAAADIAEAIFIEKAGGITTFGTTTTAVVDTEGTSHDINWTAATELTFYADVEVETNDDWNGATSIANIKTQIALYVNDLDIGEDVIYDRVKAAIFEEPGVYKITSLEMDFSASPTGTIDLVVGADEYAASDVGDIGVTT